MATDGGTTRRAWSREQIKRPVDIDVAGEQDRTVSLDGKGVVLDVRVRHHAGHTDAEDLRIVELTLVNRQPDSREARDGHWLFQTSIEVTAFPDDQAAVFAPVDDPLDPANSGNAPEDAEERRLRLLYRATLSHAKGRNVAVHAKVRAGERNAYRPTTEWLPTSRAKDLAGLLARHLGRERALSELTTAAVRDPIERLYTAMATDGVPFGEAAAYVRGYAAAAQDARDAVQVRTVWGGPATPAVPVRATAQVLTEVIAEAQFELLAMTYAARAYPALTEALALAVRRGVSVGIVVETLAGARGLLAGDEPGAAFAGVSGVRLWHWARPEGEGRASRQHAKLAVADRQLLFLGSANLTESAARRNIEAGVLVRGGPAPKRAAEHIEELQRQGVLRPWGG
ncbi:DISARM system phospholipase D-like protein DrmC [Streptomyces luteolus]|uniref:DISARM system phospholipase D-like protein DrmC n=1 Tax=Streptomyces luteolus TaxID=3043615 RepID=A0ABT6SYC3_9ACTN|nr:DISARM system phospholipase D-like protein DrmC [Streptomyces sp. B-S-A12]MDI3420618.1 DISARM system phospholipase D-like protein DrmC [Streptomyces sp. B-S-A12]